MNALTDQQLLEEFAQSRSESAFSELVRRHVDFVFSAAIRMVGDSHLAQDVTQSVFLALANNATTLAERPVLSGWLHRTTRNLAANVVRADVRRRVREQEAAAMNQLLSNSSDAGWEQVASHLDDALTELNESDRDAVLLRYFERKSAREVAAVLGGTEDAAQKRVSRAVDRLRELFAKRGVTIASGALVTTVSANAVQAAPLTLATTIISAASVTGAIVATSTTVAIATKAIAMTTLQKAIVATVLVAASAGIVYQSHRAADLDNRLQTLQRQVPVLAAQVEDLERDRTNAANRLAALQSDNEQLRRNNADLLRLRAEVTRLRSELLAASEKELSTFEAQAWLSRVTELKKRLEERPELKIPELVLVKEKDWLDVARDANTNTDAGLRQAFDKLRRIGKSAVAENLARSIRYYARAHNNQAPVSASELQPFLEPPAMPAILERYKMLQTGELKWDQPAMEEMAPVDDKYDSIYKIGARNSWYGSLEGVNGSGMVSFGTLDRRPWMDGLMPSMSDYVSPDTDAEERILDRAMTAYKAAHGGKPPGDITEFSKYLQTSEEKAAFQRIIEIEKADDEQQQRENIYEDQLKIAAPVSAAIQAYIAAHADFPDSPADLDPYLKSPEDKAALQKLLEMQQAKKAR